MKKYLVLLLIIFSLFLVRVSLVESQALLELELDYPEFGGFDLNEDQDINELIAWFYYFIVGISGFAAFIMLVWGGFQWLTSAGNPARISEAKDRLTSAFLGLIIILASFLILQVINPELVTLRLPGLP